jgi:hypothetical protein
LQAGPLRYPARWLQETEMIGIFGSEEWTRTTDPRIMMPVL